MANALYDLGCLLYNDEYKRKALTIANNIKPEMGKYISAYANYASLMLKEIYPFYEVAVVGQDAKKKIFQINNMYSPNKLYIGSSNKSSLSLLKGKFIEGETMIYVCENKSCQLPTSVVVEAKKLLE